MRLISWNVNGVRAIYKKGFLEFLYKNPSDVFCLQETKAHSPGVLNDELIHPDKYLSYWSCAQKKGYSGVVCYTKKKPVNIKTNFGDNLLSKEGRMIELDFGDFILLNIYFPNGGQGEERLQYKLAFYNQFLSYIENLVKNNKRVIFCGDINTAHKEIDLSRPKENEKHTGFLAIERKWIDDVIKSGFIDTFRMFNKEEKKYTWWDFKTRARERNVGWRIDYFFVSNNFKNKVKNAFIMPDIMGSDHCPLGIDLDI